MRPRYSRPEPPRPERRPPTVWVICLLLAALGLLGAFIGALLLQDAVSHGEEDEFIAAVVLSLLLSATQVASAAGLFFGRRWGRTGALFVCAAHIVVIIVGAATDSLGSGQAWSGVAVNGALVFALLGPKVHDWCRPPG
ncbi:hypothetical protein [Phytohabitans rumicis]|uniref:Integral membrane protein n=1 Tax=Phytohabitans rumicis TaxID=1076125 RepID=A0A6V8KX82_9ACTN|nr:hypothetical protein [Phytohabitans rumicis]GFJ88454.1 hypothetical protein Prum_020960 [Phytohabitans rumicis]